MQSYLTGNLTPKKHKRNSIINNEILSVEPSLLEIELVRYDDEDKEESSVKVSLASFLEPRKQSTPIFR